MQAWVKSSVALGVLALATVALPGTANAEPASTVDQVKTAQESPRGCGATWPAYPGVWTPAKGSCAVLGHPGFTLNIRWSAGANPATLHVKGFKNGKATWHNCGSIAGVCSVPWGNTGADVKFRASAWGGPTTVNVSY